MKYLEIYYNEDTQKVSIDAKHNNEFKFIGTATGVEKSFLIEILADRFGDNDITLKQFQRYYTELKGFCYKMKNIE